MRYRLMQFWRNVTAVSLHTKAKAEITTVLSADEYTLFERFTDSDQWHAYNVYKSLIENGNLQPDLLVAALLHDIGKAQFPMSVFSRSLVVIMGKVAPKQSAALGKGENRGWKRPFVVKAQHPEWGAQMAAAVGSSSLSVELIRRHQDPLPIEDFSETDQLLRLLQWADDQN